MSLSLEEIIEVDSRSVYVGNVDYGVALEELYHFFGKCGPMKRVTILCNKPDGHPKGFAYIEFENKESVQRALAMDMSFLRGRQIKVRPKRTNQPGLSSTNRPPRTIPMWSPGRGAGAGAGTVMPGTIEHPGGYNAVYFNYYGYM